MLLFLRLKFYYNILLSKQKELNDDFNDVLHDVLLSIKDEGLNEENVNQLEDLIKRNNNED